MSTTILSVRNITQRDLVRRWQFMKGTFGKISLCIEQLHQSEQVLSEFERLTETLERLSKKTLNFVGKADDPDEPTPTKHTLVKTLIDEICSICENVALLLKQEGMEEVVSLKVRQVCAKMRGVNGAIARSKSQVPELVTQLRVCLDIVRHDL